MKDRGRGWPTRPGGLQTKTKKYRQISLNARCHFAIKDPDMLGDHAQQ
jgi:hypothetical protein